MRSLVLAVCLVSSAHAYEVKGNAIILTPEEIATCQAEGGCAIVTRKQTEQAFAEVFQEGLAQGAQSCKKTDWRKSANRML